eukprot:jgi/Botrbrau1/22350/Bobra.0002s0028.1
MATASTSRLQKLLGLIEGGASPAIRKVAATQVAEIAKAHPRQLHGLLIQLQGILRCKTWEARVAAGECLGLIAAHVQHPTVPMLRNQAGRSLKGEAPKADPDAAPVPSQATGVKPEPLKADPDEAMPDQATRPGVKLEPVKEDPDVSMLPVEASSGLLDQLDIGHVLKQGTLLLASGGEEFETGDEGLTKAERLAKQRANLKKRLGLAKGMEGLIDTADLVKDDDLLAGEEISRRGSTVGTPREPLKEAVQLVEEMTGLSARERNQLKRKMRRDSSRTSTEGPSSKKFKVGLEKIFPELDPEAAALADADFWQEVEAGRWPFQVGSIVLRCINRWQHLAKGLLWVWQEVEAGRWPFQVGGRINLRC